MKRISIDDFINFKYVSNPRFSPDGTKISFIVQQPELERNNYSGNIYLFDTASETVSRITESGDIKSCQWTENGNLMFAAKREEGELSYWYEISPDDGEEKLAFSLPLKASSLTAAGEDRYIVKAVFDNNDDKEKPSGYEILEEAPFWEEGGGFTSGKRSRLYVYRPSTGDIEAVTGPWFETRNFAVRGDKLVYTGMEWHGAKSEKTDTGCYIYNLEDGSTRCIIEPDIIHIDVLQFLDEENIIITASDHSRHGHMQNLYLYKVNLDSGLMKCINEYEYSIGDSNTVCDACLGGGITAKTEDGRLYFVTTVGGNTYLRAVDADGRMSEYLTAPGACMCFDVHGSDVVVCSLHGQKLGELYLNGRQITFFNEQWSSEHYIETPVHHVFNDSEGFQVHGWALKPVDYEPGKKYPAILHIHGGPRTAFGEVYHHEMQMWASAGYFVFYCNPRGSDGYEDDFADIRGKFGTVDYDNIMQFMDEMLKAYPDADPSRTGVTGGSYGGFMTNWIIGHTDRFKAAVSQRSTANWITFEHTSDIGALFTYKTQTARTRTDIEKVWNHSPLKYADQCTTPTLFIHSDKDYRCWMVEGIQMFTAIKMSGCEARMCLFHDESHELSRSGKPQNRISRMKEILAWMDKYLKN